MHLGLLGKDLHVVGDSFDPSTPTRMRLMAASCRTALPAGRALDFKKRAGPTARKQRRQKRPRWTLRDQPERPWCRNGRNAAGIAGPLPGLTDPFVRERVGLR